MIADVQAHGQKLITFPIVYSKFKVNKTCQSIHALFLQIKAEVHYNVTTYPHQIRQCSRVRHHLPNHF